MHHNMINITPKLIKKKRADKAQTHGPPRNVYISFLPHKVCRTCRSSPMAVSGLGRAGICLFLSFNEMVSQSVSDLQRGGHMTMAMVKVKLMRWGGGR